MAGGPHSPPLLITSHAPEIKALLQILDRTERTVRDRTQGVQHGEAIEPVQVCCLADLKARQCGAEKAAGQPRW